MTRQEFLITLKRAYDLPEPGDGTRVLVDRLWPRGLSKKRAHVDVWLKDVAPSHELRTWFGHDPGYSPLVSDGTHRTAGLHRFASRDVVCRDLHCARLPCSSRDETGLLGPCLT